MVKQLTCPQRCGDSCDLRVCILRDSPSCPRSCASRERACTPHRAGSARHQSDCHALPQRNHAPRLAARSLALHVKVCPPRGQRGREPVLTSRPVQGDAHGADGKALLARDPQQLPLQRGHHEEHRRVRARGLELPVLIRNVQRDREHLVNQRSSSGSNSWMEQGPSSGGVAGLPSSSARTSRRRSERSSTCKVQRSSVVVTLPQDATSAPQRRWRRPNMRRVACCIVRLGERGPRADTRARTSGPGPCMTGSQRCEP